MGLIHRIVNDVMPQYAAQSMKKGPQKNAVKLTTWPNLIDGLYAPLAKILSDVMQNLAQLKHDGVCHMTNDRVVALEDVGGDTFTNKALCVPRALFKQFLGTLLRGHHHCPPRRRESSGVNLHAQVKKEGTNAQTRFTDFRVISGEAPVNALTPTKRHARKPKRWNVATRPYGATQVVEIGKLIDQVIAKRPQCRDGNMHPFANLRQRLRGDETV